MWYVRFDSLLPFLLLFLLVFDLHLIGGFGSAIITFLVCFLIILVNPSKYIVNANKIFNFFFLFLVSYIFLLFYVAFRVLLNGVSEVSFLFTMSKATLILLATLCYLIVFYNSDLKRNLINIFFFNACICLVFGTFSEYKTLLSLFQYGGDSVELIGNNEYRNAFLAGSGYFGISSLYGLVFAIVLKIIIDDKNHNFFKLLVIALAGLFAGRVALICYLIAILYYVFLKFNLRVSLFSLFSLFIFIFILNFFPVFEDVKYWLSEMFVDNNLSQSESFSQFSETFSLPSSELTLLFGDGLYGNSEEYYGGSDSGYIRNIYFGGVFYLFFLLGAFFLISYNIRKILYIYVLIFISLFLHLKGVFIFNNPGFFGVFLTSCIILFKDRNDSNLVGEF